MPSASMLEKQWKGMVWPASSSADRNPETGVLEEQLKEVGRASIKIPDGFVRQAMVLVVQTLTIPIGNPSQTAKTCEESPCKHRFWDRAGLGYCRGRVFVSIEVENSIVDHTNRPWRSVL